MVILYYWFVDASRGAQILATSAITSDCANTHKRGQMG